MSVEISSKKDIKFVQQSFLYSPVPNNPYIRKKFGVSVSWNLSFGKNFRLELISEINQSYDHYADLKHIFYKLSDHILNF